MQLRSTLEEEEEEETGPLELSAEGKNYVVARARAGRLYPGGRSTSPSGTGKGGQDNRCGGYLGSHHHGHYLGPI